LNAEARSQSRAAEYKEGEHVMENEEVEARLELINNLLAAEKALEDSGGMTDEEIEKRLELVTSLIAAEKELAEIG
jgi:hypothetical protein